jgi:hypothetical protein
MPATRTANRRGPYWSWEVYHWTVVDEWLQVMIGNKWLENRHLAKWIKRSLQPLGYRLFYKTGAKYMIQPSRQKDVSWGWVIQIPCGIKTIVSDKNIMQHWIHCFLAKLWSLKWFWLDQVISKQKIKIHRSTLGEKVSVATALDQTQSTKLFVQDTAFTSKRIYIVRSTSRSSRRGQLK